MSFWQGIERPTRPASTPYTNEQLKAAFFKLYDEQRGAGDCGECPIIEYGDGRCDALYEDGSGCDENICREAIINWYLRNVND